jgi:oligopeptide/dipeptide ABC transporter ATP-binding protein
VTASSQPDQASELVRAPAGPGLRDEPLLRVSNLRVYFETDSGLLKAVDGVDFFIGRGEALGLVGESGCGKSVTAYSILKLLDSPPAQYAGGQVNFHGQNLLALEERAMRTIRGRNIGMVFQEPMSSLNPVMSIGNQIAEAVRTHESVSRAEAFARTVDTLALVGFPDAARRFNDYPHQLSGGMKQRAMIAMALVCKPELLIADEPTTALDVTIQAQILDLLDRLRRDSGMSLLLITHDMGVVAQTCDRVAVMYAGKIVEQASAEDLFAGARHPYTDGLFKALPSITGRRQRLNAIPGSVPDPLDFPSGCRFRTRCWMAKAVCEDEPPLREIVHGHFSACHFSEELRPAAEVPLTYG